MIIIDGEKIVPFSFGHETLNEGEYAQISCIVSSGDLPLSITWSLQSDDEATSSSSNTGISTAPVGARASFLSIEAVGYAHSGKYTCIARNEAGNATFSAQLKVNGRGKVPEGTLGKDVTGMSIKWF